jgi:hypothetical protein
LWATVGWLPAQARAQQFPEAPALVSAPAEQQGARLPGTVSGTVVDGDGDAIVGAQVTLLVGTPPLKRTAIADGDGYFSFLDVPSGEVKITVAADGFATTTKPFTLRPAEDMETPDIVLPVATANMDVEVSLSEHDMAEEDIKVEEMQRLGGFLPNFYVTYNWKAPALSNGQKFKLAWRSIVDPANLVLTAGIAGVEQSTNAFSGYGQGAQGYGKRLGAGLADFTAGNLVGGAIFPSIFHQDPRYFYKGTGSIFSRAMYALSTAVICRGDNGKWQPNYSSVLGDVTAGAISQAYYPPSDRSDKIVVIETGLLNAAEDGFGNLLQEFLFKKITPSASKP